MRFMTHLLVATLISFGLSIYAWIGLGIFALLPFLTVSSVCAFAGAAIGGWLAGSNIMITMGSTTLIRVAVFLVMVGLPPYS